MADASSSVHTLRLLSPYRPSPRWQLPLSGVHVSLHRRVSASSRRQFSSRIVVVFHSFRSSQICIDVVSFTSQRESLSEARRCRGRLRTDTSSLRMSACRPHSAVSVSMPLPPLLLSPSCSPSSVSPTSLDDGLERVRLFYFSSFHRN
jgi:hypothetical protein